LAVFPFCGLYAGSKHALEAMSESLYHEVEPFGVRVVIVEPGLFRSDLARNSLTSGTGPLYGERTRKVADVLEAGTRQGADPQLVATIVADAVHAAAPQLRYPVGESAVRMRELKRTLSDEDFAAAARRHVGI
jgi:NAD(P)-dependent dehydrogenase (short-subunit alcohol dehydrogenase family)